MQMIDVINKLRELEGKSPEIAHALDNAQRMTSIPSSKSVAEDVQITLSGSDAVLAEILKLAGMLGAKVAGDDMGPGPNDVGMRAGPDMAMGGPPPSMGGHHHEHEMEGAYDASTTPTPRTQGMGAAVPAGNDLAKPKLTAPKVAGGDNPIQGVLSIG
jgi:hypothetical protein